MSSQDQFRQQLLKLFEGRNAHILFSKSLKDIPFDDVGIRPDGLPHSVWELAEHIRIAQHDILDFCQSSNYKGLDWPDDYWPASPAPESEERWQQMRQAYDEDHHAMADIIKDPENDLWTPLPHGDGQTLFHEAMLIVDHTSYHIGQIIQVRRLLGNWK